MAKQYFQDEMCTITENKNHAYGRYLVKFFS